MSTFHEALIANADQLRRARFARQMRPTTKRISELPWPRALSDNPSFPRVVGSLCDESGLTDAELIQLIHGVLSVTTRPKGAA